MSDLQTITADRKAEQERLKKLLEICEIPLSGSLSKGLQNYHGITLMDTLTLMSLVNMKQSAKIVEQIEKIDEELRTRTREQFNPDDLAGPKICRQMTPAEENMLREDRAQLLMILTAQHNQKIKEVQLMQQAAKLSGGVGGKKRKPGFTPIEIEGNGES